MSRLVKLGHSMAGVVDRRPAAIAVTCLVRSEELAWSVWGSTPRMFRAVSGTVSRSRSDALEERVEALEARLGELEAREGVRR